MKKKAKKKAPMKTPSASRPRLPSKDGLPLVTRRQLMALFGKTERTIARWLEDDMPVEVAGRGGRPSLYHLPDCVQWALNRERQAAGGEAGQLSPQLERAKLDQRRREDLELKLEVRRGELVDVSTVQEAWADLAVAVRARLRAIPDAVADQVEGLAPASVKALLLARIDDALRELARGQATGTRGHVEGGAADADEPLKEAS